MCHDGASSTPFSNDAVTAGQNVKITDVNATEASRRIIFRSFIRKLIGRGYNVALINGLEFVDTKVGLSGIPEPLDSHLFR